MYKITTCTRHIYNINFFSKYSNISVRVISLCFKCKLCNRVIPPCDDSVEIRFSQYVLKDTRSLFSTQIYEIKIGHCDFW